MLFRISLILGLTSCLAIAETEENVREQVDAGAGGNLVVDVGFGTVEITPGSGDKVAIDAHRMIDMHDEASEKRFLEEAPIIIHKDGNTVSLSARRSDNRGWSWHGHINMDAKFTVHVPKNFNLDLRTGGGNISVDEVKGQLKASTSGGKLKLTKLQGPVDAKTSGGGISVAECEGPLVVKTSGGNITGNGGNGSLDARTSGGSVDVRDFKGDTLVRTSGGNLRLENISGKVSGETSGGGITASLVSPVPGDVELSSSAGSIVLNVPSDAAINVDARASSGSVSNSLPLTTTRNEREELRGAMNGGGKSVLLRANAGSVSLRPAPAKTAMH
ncbi:MAG: DUF4097 domain-containing protein [Verrucomicrobiota bacterium]|nr:DUF4097 domain-containing protein [Verrucomicrobiota bacterium]